MAFRYCHIRALGLVFAFCLCGAMLFAQAANEQTPVKTGARGTVTSSRLPTNTFHFKAQSADDLDRIAKLKEINELISQIYMDEINNKFDIKKFERLKKLADELPGGPPEKKKGFWKKLF